MKPGRYELVFDAGAYLGGASDETPFFDDIPIRFVIADPAAHYQVPPILSRFGCATYRES